MTCPTCGAELPAGALFCGECGQSVAPRRASVSRPPTAPIPSAFVSAAPVPEEAADDVPVTELPVIPAGLIEIPVVVAPVQEVPPAPSPPPVPERPSPETPVAGLPDPLVAPVQPAQPPLPVVERFVLQFSTGESVTVTGSGLVGRNPSAEPGEYVDHLVPVVDHGKSVSKTHLEFGQADGSFWVSDRYSGNGSTVRQPDAKPRRCEPGKRYIISRGTRVDIGDQFFVVS